MPCSVIFWVSLSLLQSSILVFSGIGEASSAGACDGSDETCTAVPGILTFSQDRLSTLLEKVPCNVERIDAREMDAKTFEETYRRGDKPLIVRNWTGQWRAHSRWQDGGFRKHLGDLELTVKYQLVPEDHDDAIGRMTVEQFLASPQKNLMFDTGDWSLHGSRARDDIFPLPEALETAYEQPVYTIGRNGTGSSFHQHEEAWISQVVGIKVWVLAPEFLESGITLDSSELGAGGKITKVEPCELVHRLAEDRASFHETLQTCAVGPGETVYIPNGMHHATCNFGDLTVGVGARGDSSTSAHTFRRYVQLCELEKVKAHVEKHGDPGRNASIEFPSDPVTLAGTANCLSIVEYLLERRGVKRVDANAKANTRRYKMAADRTLYVSNLNDKISAETMRSFLRGVFQEFGAVANVIVLTSLKRRGQALIIFKEAYGVEHSLQVFQGIVFFSKTLKLSAAKGNSSESN